MGRPLQAFRRALCALALGVLALSVPGGADAGAPPAKEETMSAALADRYPDDAGLAGDPQVLFADDFESWQGDTPPAGAWDGLSTGGTRRVRLVPGAVTPGGPGRRVLQVSCWQEGDHDVSAGLSKHLGNYQNSGEGRGDGYEEVWIRYYQRFDEGYLPGVANHGSLLGGRDLTHPDARWVGMADTRDVASHGYFSGNLQPYVGRDGKPFHWGFYSYHCDKPGRWGDYFEPVRMATIEVGRWYCLEWHMKLNTADPLAADGVEELYVDGELSIRKTGLRYRKVPQLRITFFNLGVYYHPGLPAQYTSEHPISVSYDNLVIATQRVGPRAARKPAAAGDSE